MENDNTKPLGRVIRIDESEIRGHLDEMVRGTVEETLNGLLDAEADEIGLPDFSGPLITGERLRC